MHPSPYYIGLDISTQGAKLLVLDYERRLPIFTSTVQYDKDLPEYKTIDGHRRCNNPLISESSPKMWIDAVNKLLAAFQAAGFDGQRVRAIAVSGQQHGLVCIDAKGSLTRAYAKLWNDTSTELECEELTSSFGGQEKMIAAVGNAQKPGYTASKILNFKKEDPEAFQRTDQFLLVHNYINYYLSDGVLAMEPGDASGTALMQISDLNWCEKLCRLIDPSLTKKLPKITAPNRFIGKISKTLASRFGISPDCQIDPGSGDNMFGAIGTGNVQEGVVTISLGTSGTAYAFSEKLYRSPDGEVAVFCDATGNYLPLVCVANLANGYNQFLDEFKITHQEFEQLVHKTPAGNQGRILIPWFTGERTPNLPLATPIFFGFSLSDFKPEILARAVLEGHILNLYEAYSKLPVEAKLVHVTGGLARSTVFRQAIADIFGVEVVPVVGEGAALGAAIHAAWIDQDHSLPMLCGEIIQPDQALRAIPNPNDAPTYVELRNLYLDLSKRLREGDDRVNPFTLHHTLANKTQDAQP